jgi:hypothetical protein
LRALLYVLALSASGLALGCIEEEPAPAVPEPPLPPPVSPIVGEGVLGSDGSYGWRSREPPDLQAELARARAAGCAVQVTGAQEWRGTCSGVNVLARGDASSLYRLCTLGTDRTRCAEAWQAIRLAAPRG